MNTRCAVALLVVAISFTRADDLPRPPKPVDPHAALRPLYSYGVFPGLLTNAGVKMELKITKAQEPAWERAVGRWRGGFVRWTDRSKPIDFPALEQANFNAMMDYLGKTLDATQLKRLKQLALQQSGMEMFEYQDIRDSVGLTEADVKKLKDMHGKMLGEISGGGKGKYTPKEVGQMFGEYSHGVPDRVRGVLPDAKRKKLDDLLGEQFRF